MKRILLLVFAFMFLSIPSALAYANLPSIHEFVNEYNKLQASDVLKIRVSDYKLASSEDGFDWYYLEIPFGLHRYATAAGSASVYSYGFITWLY